MRTTAKGLALIKEFEGLRLEAYLCPAGVWTIGWGHTKGVKKGDRIDISTAEKYLKEDIEEAERGIEKLVKVKLDDNQFSALVSFVFNFGETKFRSSTLLRVINTDPYSPNVAVQFRRWVYADGKISQGLIRRREAEVKLYQS